MNDQQWAQTLQNRARRRGPIHLDVVVAEVLADRSLLVGDSESPIEGIVAAFLGRHLMQSVRIHQNLELPGYAGRLRPDFFLFYDETGIVLEADGAEYHKDLAADRARDMQLFVRVGIDEIWHFPGSAIRRNVAATLARFVLTHPRWFQAEVRAEFEHACVVTSPAFLPLKEAGWYETPTPGRARATFRAYWAKAPAMIAGTEPGEEEKPDDAG